MNIDNDISIILTEIIQCSVYLAFHSHFSFIFSTNRFGVSMNGTYVWKFEKIHWMNINKTILMEKWKI